jgi:hypothetical protein
MKENTLMKMKKSLRSRHLQKQSKSGFSLVITLMLSAFLFSCDQLDSIDDVIDKDKANQVRVFEAELHPLNNSGVTGTASFTYIEDGNFQAEVNARNLAPGMVHSQHIQGFGFEEHPQDAVCPPMDAAGDDGLLTIPDGAPFYGSVLIPLDDNLVPLEAEDFPMVNGNGRLNYAQRTNVSQLVSAIDEGHEGHQSLKNLMLEKRVVVIHGAYVKDNQVVAAGTEGAEYMATLPVACGEIKEVH